MTEISRQKTPELKIAVDILIGKDQQEISTPSQLTLSHKARAFKHMDKYGMVHIVVTINI